MWLGRLSWAAWKDLRGIPARKRGWPDLPWLLVLGPSVLELDLHQGRGQLGSLRQGE